MQLREWLIHHPQGSRSIHDYLIDVKAAADELVIINHPISDDILSVDFLLNLKTYQLCFDLVIHPSLMKNSMRSLWNMLATRNGMKCKLMTHHSRCLLQIDFSIVMDETLLSN